MRPERLRRHALIFATSALVAVALAAGCGGERPPLRIGVVGDCMGYYRSLQDAEISGAELALIERGAHRRDRRAGGAITPATVAGRRVELVRGYTEALEFSTLTTEVRRLIEHEHVDAVIAAGTGADEVALRDVAARYPHVIFLPVAHGPREVTLRRAVPNLFRVVGDHDQDAAGLGTYAYRTLGWRRAAVVVGSWDPGWGERDAFMAEFCALGGKITRQVSPVGPFDPAGSDASQVPRGVDGVAIFAFGFFGPQRLIERIARRRKDPAGSIIVGAHVVDDPDLRKALGGALAGVTGSSSVDPARMRSYLRTYARAFPGAPIDTARNELVTGYRDAVQALLQALVRAHGDERRLAPELGRLRVSLLGGPIRLDGRAQAVVTTRLVRLGAGPRAPARVLRTIPGVDESIGGLLEPSQSPVYFLPSCKRSTRRAPWAR